MKIITCASYHGTGSSAITDFFSEFSNCSSVESFEFRLVHDPDGIRDLEYNIIENNNRLNTSYAIKKYIKNVKHLNGNILTKKYQKYFGENFLMFSKTYIHDITELICKSSWEYDERGKGNFLGILSKLYRRIFRLFNSSFENSLLLAFGEKGYYSAIDKDAFYFYTKKYINNLLKHLNSNGSEYLMVDQLLPPSNIKQYLNYFDNIKVVIVDRDPRDLFILASKYWKSSIIPHKNVEEFCKWYEITRRHRKHENLDTNYSMYIQFEDLIYKYKETTQKLIEFIGIDSKKNINPMTKFDPTISVKNTNLKEKFPKYKKEIEYIEVHLKEYLYDFPKYVKNTKEQKMKALILNSEL